MSELKPCPFCGCEDVGFKDGTLLAGSIYCPNCTAEVEFDSMENFICDNRSWRKTHAIKWNRRVENEDK